MLTIDYEAKKSIREAFGKELVELGTKNPLDKKRYEIFNDFGVNMDTNKKQVVDFDMQVKRHKNSDCH